MTQQYTDIETAIPVVGRAKIRSPLLLKKARSQGLVSDSQRVLLDVNLDALLKSSGKGLSPPALEKAGPRSRIYFDPSKLRCALVTCGGLCPGLNAIIRAVVLELVYGYGVTQTYGIKYGFQGFIPRYKHDVVPLSAESVTNIIRKGGSIIGSSRGHQDVGEIVDSLQRMNIGALFVVGGDGTLVAASRITKVIMERGLNISIIGIPKTIDNDIFMVSRSFGFDTAVEIATQSIRAAHNEARGYPNGIGLIKLMGRYSGFIAATAALAQDANFVLIPEVDFDLHGPKGLLPALENRLHRRGHGVIVVAEGAGQRFFEDGSSGHDLSGNKRLKDIGLYLKEAITAHFEEKEIPISIKYIDPSYLIRSLPANANDQVFCSFLGRNAVHAAMAGKTGMLVGYWNNHFVHLPMSASAGKRKQVDPGGELWLSVLDATGQGPLKNA